MRKILIALALAGAALCLPGAPAQAQATRTWVSGVGDDANPCSRTAPCKTWAGAISKTANGGEIDALDPGGFGALTITKSITLDGGGGQVASTLVAGTNGFNISATASDVIIIKNLRIQGLLGNGGNPANSGQTAIQINTAATVVIENCEIYGFAVNGIKDARSAGGKLLITNTQVFNTGGTGISLAQSSGSTRLDASLSRVSVFDTGNSGIFVNAGIRAVIYRSTFQGSTGSGIDVEGAAAEAHVTSSVTSNNATGIFTSGGGTVFISDTDIVTNGTGITGATSSYVNNRISGNGTPGTAPTPASPGPQ